MVDEVSFSLSSSSVKSYLVVFFGWGRNESHTQRDVTSCKGEKGRRKRGKSFRQGKSAEKRELDGLLNGI